MKRSLIYILLAVVVAGVLGTLVARDPGYVLISYDGASLQTGLWVMLAMIALLVAALYWLLRLFKLVGNSASAFRSWRSTRASSRASKLASRGLIFFQEGEYERAERFLQSGARAGSNPAVNFIYAARAADAQGKREQREAYLRQASEADADAARAIAVARAEMALERREYDKALTALEGLKASLPVTRLKSRALVALEKWPALLEVIPQLRKAGAPDEELFSLQKQAAMAQFSETGLSDDELTAVYKQLSDDIKRDADVLLAYCRSLDAETAAEAAIRAALKQVWHPELVTLYGSLGRETLERRIKAALGWQKQHPDDAALQLCLGELYEASGDKDKALACYQKSVDLGHLPLASKHIGRLLAFEGDYKKSNEYLIQAINAEGL